MKYRRFGKTEVEISVLSFGCMRSMHSWDDIALDSIPAASTANLKTLLETALAHGINHIETAHGYGSSEAQLGTILPQLKRDQFYLQTKVSPAEDSELFTSKVLRSLDRLQVDSLDFLALHGINDHRSLWYSCRKGGCLEAARKLQDQGKVRHIGFSGHGPTDVIIEAMKFDEYGGFDFANVHWYYIFDANRAAIEYGKERDIGIFIISPSDKGGYLHTPSSTMVELCSPLSPMLFNDLYCLNQPGVCTISLGASEPHHFDEHLKVMQYLDADQPCPVDEIDARLRQRMSAWSGYERPDHFWDQLPPWDQAPGNINIRMILWLYNLATCWGLETYSRERYDKLAGGSAWVPGNNGARAERTDFSALKGISGLTPEKLSELLCKAHTLFASEQKV